MGSDCIIFDLFLPAAWFGFQSSLLNRIIPMVSTTPCCWLGDRALSGPEVLTLMRGVVEATHNDGPVSPQRDRSASLLSL